MERTAPDPWNESFLLRPATNGLQLVTIQSGHDLDAALDQRFGRAPQFLVVDTDEARVVETVRNDAAEAAHAAGPAAARLVAKHRVEAVVSGRYGRKAAQALLALGIRAYEAGDRISPREVVEAYRTARQVGSHLDEPASLKVPRGNR